MTRIAHLLSHYPHPSHSFLRDEVIGLREAGVEIETIALNPAVDAHILTDIDRSERERTRYVKAQPRRALVAAIGATALRHPAQLARFIVWAALQGRPDPVMMARRTAQALEAVVVHRWCRQSGIDHVHAHFGGAPGTVAWFAAALSQRIDRRRPLSWSITIHGPHDFMNERSANLPALVANADLVVAISDFTAAQLLRLAPPSRRNRVQVVRCGIDLQLFAERDPSVDHRVTDEVWLESTPGHTPGHVSVRIASGGQEAVITGDLMHHPIQCCEPELCSAFDWKPELTRVTRRDFLVRHSERPVLVLGTHFAPPTAGWLVRSGEGWELRAEPPAA